MNNNKTKTNSIVILKHYQKGGKVSVIYRLFVFVEGELPPDVKPLSDLLSESEVVRAINYGGLIEALENGVSPTTLIVVDCPEYLTGLVIANQLGAMGWEVKLRGPNRGEPEEIIKWAATHLVPGEAFMDFLMEIRQEQILAIAWATQKLES